MTLPVETNVADFCLRLLARERELLALDLATDALDTEAAFDRMPTTSLIKVLTRTKLRRALNGRRPGREIRPGGHWAAKVYDKLRRQAEDARASGQAEEADNLHAASLAALIVAEAAELEIDAAQCAGIAALFVEHRSACYGSRDDQMIDHWLRVREIAEGSANSRPRQGLTTAASPLAG